MLALIVSLQIYILLIFSKTKILILFVGVPGVGIAELKAQSRHCSTHFLNLNFQLKIFAFLQAFPGILFRIRYYLSAIDIQNSLQPFFVFFENDVLVWYESIYCIRE
jgi:hypothetical protein